MQGKKSDVNVKKVTKNYEIIEVNGFAIKKRKSGNPPKEIETQPKQGSYITPLRSERVSEPVQRTPNVEEYEISAELYERLTKALHEIPIDGEPSGRLLAVCSSVCAAEIDVARRCGDEHAIKGLEIIFDQFLNGISSLLDRREIVMAPPSSENYLNEADLQIDLESRKQGLRRRLDILKREEEEWNTLLQKIDSIELDVPIEHEVGVQQGSTHLAEKEIEELQKLNDSIKKQVSLQVEGVSLLVGNIEDLIEKANEKAVEIQREQQAERFKSFPHANSPVRLIKAIISKKD